MWKYSYCESIVFNNLSCYRIFKKKKNGEKYLILDLTQKYEEVFSRIRSEIETINSGEKLFYEKHYSKIGVNTDDNAPLNKKLKFPSLTIIIRCVFQNGKKMYDECL